MERLTEMLFELGDVPVICPVKKTASEVGRNLFRYLFRRKQNTSEKNQHERTDGYYCNECDKVHPLLDSIRDYAGC